MSTSSSNPVPSPPRPVGSIVAGRYQIESVLGQGGMGDVYLVRHMVMRKRLALKLLRPEISQVAEFAARFEREAMAAASIDHPHVAAATDCGKTDDGTLFLALEYIEGQSLRQALQAGPLSVQRALHIAQQAARAMVRAHELGIIHRDLKPENIMLTRRDGDPDFVKVLDFGLAKLSAGSTSNDQAATVQKLTQYGEIFGTPQYMAPEQTTGGETDGRTDLYALGIILYEMLAGCLPFDGKDISDFLRHQLVTQLPPLRKRAPQVSVPDGIEALVRRLCMKNPDDRFQSAELFVEALETAVQEHKLVLVPPRARSSSPGGVSSSGAIPAASALIPPPAPAAGGAPRAAAPLPNTASIVMFMQAVGKAQKRLPSVLQRVSTEKLVALLSVLALAFFIGIFFLAAKIRSSTPEHAERVQAPKTPKSEGPTAEELQTASAGGVASLQQLAQRFPDAMEPLRALATAYIHQGQVNPALTTLGQLAHKDRQTLNHPEFAQFITTQVMSNREEVSGAALRVLEGNFGDQGVDLLIKLADSLPPRARGRFNVSLNNMRARADLTPGTQALLELRAASKCEQKHVALLKIRQIGDARSLPFLYALQTPNGCAPFGLGDCWGCLRQSTDLADTITAVTSRAGGAGPAPTKAEDPEED